MECKVNLSVNLDRCLSHSCCIVLLNCVSVRLIVQVCCSDGGLCKGHASVDNGFVEKHAYLMCGN